MAKFKKDKIDDIESYLFNLKKQTEEFFEFFENNKRDLILYYCEKNDIKSLFVKDSEFQEFFSWAVNYWFNSSEKEENTKND